MKREHWWPAALAAVLLVTVLANVGVFVIAARNGGAEAVPGYYQRALRWDSSVAERARSAGLRWRADATLAPAAAGAGVFTLSLADSAGEPVTRGRARLEGYPVARADRRFHVALVETAAGRYQAAVPLAAAEWQELEVTVRSGAARYLLALRCLPGGGCRPA